MAYRKIGKKRTRKKKPGWIYPGDLCWLKTRIEAYPASTSWDYTEAIIRILYTDEPIIYIRRTRENHTGTLVHHFECLGLNYVYRGSINDFTKNGPVKRPDRWDSTVP